MGNRIDHWARYSAGTESRRASQKALKSTSEGLKQSKYLSGIACPPDLDAYMHRGSFTKPGVLATSYATN